MKLGMWLKLGVVVSLVALWVGCGPPQQGPGPEVVPEVVSKNHQPPEPPTSTPPPPERPDDKPNDPALFDTGSSVKWIGDACTSNDDCSFSGGYCMKESTGFPGGYCMRSCTKYCPDRSGKPFTFCASRAGKGACFSRCDVSLYPGTGCREGYKCRDEGRHGQSSIKRGICVPDPNATPAPPPPTNPTDPPSVNSYIGEKCTKDSDCAFSGGVCNKEDNGYPKGHCTRSCTKYCPDKAGKPSTFCVSRSGKGACFSRCDVGAFPGSGCREGYSCQEEGRFNQSWVKRNVCVPSSSTPPTPPPTPPTPPPTGAGDLPVTPGLSCYDQLAKWGVKFTRSSNPNTQLSGASRRCSIEQPLRLQPPILGVDYVIWTKKRITMLVGCRIALRIARFSHYLKNRGITKVMHLGTYNCRKIAGSSRLSNHSFGQAIDLAAFYSSAGTEYDLVKHWDHSTTWTRSGNMGCWSSRFNSPQAKVLYEIACDMWKKNFFSLILTPNYNRAHDNHFHVDLTSSGKVLSTDVGYIGKYQDTDHKDHD